MQNMKNQYQKPAIQKLDPSGGPSECRHVVGYREGSYMHAESVHKISFLVECCCCPGECLAEGSDCRWAS